MNHSAFFYYSLSLRFCMLLFQKLLNEMTKILRSELLSTHESGKLSNVSGSLLADLNEDKLYDTLSSESTDLSWDSLDSYSNIPPHKHLHSR